MEPVQKISTDCKANTRANPRAFSQVDLELEANRLIEGAYAKKNHAKIIRNGSVCV